MIGYSVGNLHLSLQICLGNGEHGKTGTVPAGDDGGGGGEEAEPRYC